MPYFDTSVIVAYYCPEPLSAAAERFLRRRGPPAISWLTQVEFASAVARKVREGAIERGDAGRVVERFHMHIAEGAFAVHALTAACYGTAFHWLRSLTTDLRTLDALHLAVAAEMREEVVTADARMAAAAKVLRIRCRFVA